MRIRTTILAAAIAALPALALAQTATPPAATSPSPETSSPAPSNPATSNPSATSQAPRHHHDRAEWRQRRTEMHQKYEQLSANDKAKFDELGKQIRQLQQQRMQILGMSKS